MLSHLAVAQSNLTQRLCALPQVVPADDDHTLGWVEAEAGGHDVRSTAAIDGGQPPQPLRREVGAFLFRERVHRQTPF